MKKRRFLPGWWRASSERATNVVELPFAAARLRTDAAKRFKTVERATAVIGD